MNNTARTQKPRIAWINAPSPSRPLKKAEACRNSTPTALPRSRRRVGQILVRGQNSVKSAALMASARSSLRTDFSDNFL